MRNTGLKITNRSLSRHLEMRDAMRYFTGLMTLTLLAICLPVVAFANADAAFTAGIPEWVSSYPGAEPRIKSSIENSPGLDVTFAFATDDPPERVAEFYTQKLQVAGLNPAT